jgi:hypothetical protein
MIVFPHVKWHDDDDDDDDYNLATEEHRLKLFENGVEGNIWT